MDTLLPNSRRPDVTFYPDGRIDITAHVAKILHMQQGDVIDIVLAGAEYLLYVRLRSNECVGRHEAQVYPSKRGKHKANNFRAYSKTICRAIRKAATVPGGFSAGENSPLRLPAGTPITYGTAGTAIPLITRNPL